MIRTLATVTLLTYLPSVEITAGEDLGKALVFHAPFDYSPDAAVAGGDQRLFTTETGNPKDGKPGLHRGDVTLVSDGRHGSALRFGTTNPARLYFRAEDTVPYKPDGWSATFSLWLRLNPGKDLKPGYSDPFQITDKKWNDAALFLDFTKDDVPRSFRLGVFSDTAHWNPKKRKWNDIPEAERPLVTVTYPPFSRPNWTHVVVTCANFNTSGDKGKATLFLNGKPRGALDGAQTFTWDLSKTAMFLGIAYIGELDDFAVFDRALTATEVAALHKLKGGVETLYAEKPK
jgi:hypothetical protein